MPYISVLQKYTGWKGRASRREFWGFTIVQLILLAIAVLVDELVFPEQSEWRGGPITAMFLLLTITPWVCVWARRLQDRHDSGFLQLLFWVPMVVAIILDRALELTLLAIIVGFLSGLIGVVLLFLCALPGDAGENKYDAQPEAAQAMNGVEVVDTNKES